MFNVCDLFFCFTYSFTPTHLLAITTSISFDFDFNSPSKSSRTYPSTHCYLHPTQDPRYMYIPNREYRLFSHQRARHPPSDNSNANSGIIFADRCWILHECASGLGRALCENHPLILRAECHYISLSVSLSLSRYGAKSTMNKCKFAAFVDNSDNRKLARSRNRWPCACNSPPLNRGIYFLCCALCCYYYYYYHHPICATHVTTAALLLRRVCVCVRDELLFGEEFLSREVRN